MGQSYWVPYRGPVWTRHGQVTLEIKVGDWAGLLTHVGAGRGRYWTLLRQAWLFLTLFLFPVLTMRIVQLLTRIFYYGSLVLILAFMALSSDLKAIGAGYAFHPRPSSRGRMIMGVLQYLLV